jgi:bifunctional non-homologous end joining protein LigD
MQVEDHPLDYGDFEGVIPEGYGAGIVMLWDKGTWEPEDESADVGAALKAGQLKFRLRGCKLKGSWVLVRMKGPFGGGKGAWLLIKHKDSWSGPVDITQATPKSIKTDMDFPEILAAERAELWPSHMPAKGGATGKLLGEIIRQATAMKVQKEPGQTGGGIRMRRNHSHREG